MFNQSINTLPTSDATKTLLPITTELILLPIITEIMEDKLIETITYVKSVSIKKPSIDRIKPHLLKIDDENLWSIENLPNLLQEMFDKGLIELVDDSYKTIKQKNVRWWKRL